MGPPFPTIDERIEEADATGFLIEEDSENGNQRYLSGFNSHGTFFTLYADGSVSILTGTTEYTRAKKESHADHVHRRSEYATSTDGNDTQVTELDALTQFLADHGTDHVVVPPGFPIQTARALEDSGVTVTIDSSEAVLRQRQVKTRDEVAAIEQTQRVTEAAMQEAELVLCDAEIGDDVLLYQGQPLTGSYLKSRIETMLLEEGVALHDTIVACGADAADPHGQTDDVLRPNDSIVIDIFPQNLRTGYHADMTRTFVKGKPGDELQQLYEEVFTAFEAALDSLAAGVTGDEVCHRMHDALRRAGHATVVDDPDIEEGALHFGGHGVGLDVHERPSVEPDGPEFEAGNVITIEPGLYYPDTGGVRIEDIVEITEKGYESLTDYPKQFVIE